MPAPVNPDAAALPPPMRFLAARADGFTLSRWLFLRLIGLCYLIAFVSLWTQLDGLIGERGIIPAGDWLRAVAQQVGIERWWKAPTLCWLNFSDGFRHLLCAAGTVCSLLVIAGVATRLALVLLWAFYLSLSSVSGLFLGYQWDTLLLEAGFLAILFAPANWLPRSFPRWGETPSSRVGVAETRLDGVSPHRAPSQLALWLTWWLLFRLMFMAGAVKLLSNDDAWWDLSALTIHYETQCIPARLGWWAHQLPGWVHTISCAIMFLVELGAPFLIVCGRLCRRIAALSFIGLMLLIALTGNYCFFNLLTVALSVTLLDDAALKRLMPGRVKAALGLASESAAPSSNSPTPGPSEEGSGQVAGGRLNADVQFPSLGGARGGFFSTLAWLRIAALLTVTIFILWVSGVQTFARLFSVGGIPGWIAAPLNWAGPFRTINSYGLFAVMTKTRPEIIVEGSNDGQTWLAYEFKWKAGDLKRAPGYVAPHQPRLDWQMWFAALQDVRGNPWFVNFLGRLLQGEPRVLALMETNPFPEKPPRYIRAVLYEYRFTNRATRAQTGEWWRRELKGLYCPALTFNTAGALETAR